MTGTEHPPLLTAGSRSHPGSSLTVPAPPGGRQGYPTTLIIVPRLGRPERVEPFLEGVAAATSRPYRVVFVISDPADHIDGVDELECPEVSWPHKINHAYRNSSEPFLFCAADDLLPHPGWLEECHAAVAAGFDVVGVNDLGNTSGVVTHPFLTRTYADRWGTVDGPGAVVCDEYPHQFVDNEFTITAAVRGRLTHRPAAIVEHLHPFWKKAEWDETYERGHSLWAESEQVFQRRLPWIEERLVAEGHSVSLR